MRRIVIAVLCAAALFSCSNKVENEDEGGHAKPGSKPVNIALSIDTRVSNDAFEAGDQVGIYMSYENGLASSSNYSDNQCFRSSSGKWQSDKTLYWKDDKTPADFYCYYPYRNVTDARACPIQLAYDQSTETNYNSCDHLWGKSVSVQAGSTVKLSLSHIMSKMVIYLEPGDGFSRDEFRKAEKSISIGGIKMDAALNLEEGSVTAEGNLVTVKPLETEDGYMALIVPQKISSARDFLKVDVAGVSYTSTGNFVFEPMTQHNFTVKVDKSAAGLDITINKWKIDEEDHLVIVK